MSGTRVSASMLPPGVSLLPLGVESAGAAVLLGYTLANSRDFGLGLSPSPPARGSALDMATCLGAATQERQVRTL